MSASARREEKGGKEREKKVLLYLSWDFGSCARKGGKKGKVGTGGSKCRITRQKKGREKKEARQNFAVVGVQGREKAERARAG